MGSHGALSMQNFLFITTPMVLCMWVSLVGCAMMATIPGRPQKSILAKFVGFVQDSTTAQNTLVQVKMGKTSVPSSLRFIQTVAVLELAKAGIMVRSYDPPPNPYVLQYPLVVSMVYES